MGRRIAKSIGFIVHLSCGCLTHARSRRCDRAGAIDLQFFLVNEFSGNLENRIFNDVRWSPLEALPDYDFLAADLGLIRDLSEGKLL